MHRLNLTAAALIVATLSVASTAAADSKPFQLTKSAALFQHEGCLFISADLKEVACIHHEPDTGYFDTIVTIHTASGPYLSKRHFKVYSGNSGFEAAGVSKDFDKANAYLKAKGFTQSGIVKPNGYVRGSATYTTFGLDNKAFQARGYLPPTTPWTAQERLCCGWAPQATVAFPKAKKVVITFQKDCLWTSKSHDKTAACYNADACVDDDCLVRRPDQLVFVVAEEKP